MPAAHEEEKASHMAFFQTFLLENSHFPLKQVNVLINFICEKIQDPYCTNPKFKMIKLLET